jgi:hypothetical protein
MKKTLFVIALALISALPSCRKDADDIQKDLCLGIICQNGGQCVNGQCECPPQYTGPSCAQEKPPVKMRVTNIQLNSFPPTDPNGGGWDVFDGPDVYITISQGSTILYSSGYYENATGALLWAAANVEFTNPTATYTITAWDYDFGITGDDLMGSINFTPYQPGQKFPTQANLSCTGCPVAFTFSGIVYTH